jgi:hypothetical protein
MKRPITFFRVFSFVLILNFFLPGILLSQENSLKPGSIFREYSYKKLLSPYKVEFAYNDSFYVDLNIDDLDKAIVAEIALKYWGGHSGTSDQTFRINRSGKFNFPQPKTPNNPYCYYRTVLGNPPVEVPVNLFKKGENRFTFYCGPQICYNFNWPHYWLYSFAARIYYSDSKDCVKGMIQKGLPKDTAFNLVGIKTEVDDPLKVESVEYIGCYEDYDLDGDGKQAGWHYTIDNGLWDNIIDKKYLPPYDGSWNNFWVPEQYKPIKIIAKINSENGISFLSQPIEYKGLKQKGTFVKMYNTERLDENFGVRIGTRKECNIPINDDPAKAVSAYIVLSCWSGAPDDGAIHQLGINGKVLADSPGILHDYTFLKIPVPLEYLKKGNNTFFIYSETKGHAFEVNFPGPSILIRYLE